MEADFDGSLHDMDVDRNQDDDDDDQVRFCGAPRPLLACAPARKCSAFSFTEPLTRCLPESMQTMGPCIVFVHTQEPEEGDEERLDQQMGDTGDKDEVGALCWL